MTVNNYQARRLRGRMGHAAAGSRQMRGVSLIEVLVSVVILGVGLLGIAAMQSVALRSGQSSLESSQGVMQTMSITEAMRANRGDAGAYNLGAMQCTVPAGGRLAQNDIAAWITALKDTIGSGAATDTSTCGQITGCPLNCVITVRWDDSRAGGGATRQVVTRARI